MKVTFILSKQELDYLVFITNNDIETLHEDDDDNQLPMAVKLRDKLEDLKEGAEEVESDHAKFNYYNRRYRDQ
jgi:hypothetical protein